MGNPTDNNNNKLERSSGFGIFDDADEAEKSTSGFGIFDDADEDEQNTPQKVVVPNKNNMNMSNDGNSDRKRPAPPPDNEIVDGGSNNNHTSHNKKGKSNDDTTITITTTMTMTSSTATTTMTRKCAQCEETKPRSDFSKAQWQKKAKTTTSGGGGSRCTSCVQHLHQPVVVELSFTCSICQEEKPRCAYTKSELKVFRAEKQKAGALLESTTTTRYYLPRCRVCLDHRRKQQLQQHLEEEEKEKERLRNLPRPCQKCGQAKPKDAYSTHQWNEYTYAIRCEDDIVNSTKQTCSVCYPLEQEQADRDEAERQRREQAKKDARNDFLHMVKAGKMHYEFPDAYLNEDDWWTTFQKIPTTNDDHRSLLEGSYDILFQRVHCHGERSESHTTCGSLVLSIKNNIKEEKGLGCLVGTLTFPDDLPASIADCFKVDYTIVEVVDPNKKDGHDDHGCGEIKFELTKESFVGTHLERGEEQGHTKLKIISRTIQCPWKGCFGHPWMDDRHVRDFLDDDYDDYDDYHGPFETLEEALVRKVKQERSQSTDSWICHHLLDGKLPDIAQHIHEYVAWRPDPVFCFQKGDLLLTTLWDSESEIESHLLARKKE